MSDKLMNWLKSNTKFLKIKAIEETLNMPDGTLKKYVDGKRDLPERWRPTVLEWIKNFKK